MYHGRLVFFAVSSLVRVGIGTADPAVTLDVQAPAGSSGSLRVASSVSTSSTPHSESLEFGSVMNGAFNPGASIRFSSSQTTASSNRRLLSGSDVLTLQSNNTAFSGSVSVAKDVQVAGSFSTTNATVNGNIRIGSSLFCDYRWCAHLFPFISVLAFLCSTFLYG